MQNSSVENNQPTLEQCAVKCSLRPGDIIDVNTYGEHWDLRYGSVDRIEDDGVVWTMRYPAHDGCKWMYKTAFAKVRLAANCT